MRRTPLATPLARAFAALLTVSLVAAACGSDDDDASSPDDSESADDSESVDDATDDDSAQSEGDESDSAEADAGDEASDGDSTGGGDTNGSGAIADEVVIAIGSEQGSLNPYTYSDGEGLLLLTLVHDTLLGLDAQNQPVPLLAEEWSVSDDGLQWDLTLRDDVTWHDGEPFDAEDVAFTFDYVTEDANAHPLWTPGVAPVESVEVVSPTNAVINLTSANADFAVRPLASLPILAEHVWADIADPQNATVDASVGTGAYQLASYDTDQAYTLTAYGDYALGTPLAETVVLAIIPEASTSFAALRAGEVDIVSAILEPQLVGDFEADPAFGVSQGAGYRSTLMQMNNERPPFDDPEIRRAIGLAIDPQELIDSVLLGQGTAPNPGFLHPDGPLTVATS